MSAIIPGIGEEALKAMWDDTEPCPNFIKRVEDEQLKMVFDYQELYMLTLRLMQKDFA